jgi:amino acid transporter
MTDTEAAELPAELPNSWEFAGWGTAERIAELDVGTRPSTASIKPHKKLGMWSSTAICGNDITSSCLYVSALCAAQAGALAPVVLAIVAAVLYLFRKVYAEVGSALPLNGGTYTVLLNTTNKRMAAAAAVLTLLSYVATAVISAGEAMHYAHNLWSELPIFGATLVLLAIFAVLNIIGIAESAVVALSIFLFHMLTLTVLVIAGTIAVIKDPSMFIANWNVPSADGFMHALFFGFAAAMLGISGFESSANFIEEQEEGVFPKTLRNMWIAVAVFNPLISLLSLALIPLIVIQGVPPDLLAQMGERSWGGTLRIWISIDAVLVLSGAVLTSYVGVTGLMKRMSLDRCLPQVLLQTNRWRNTNHWIILGFFLICCSILLATAGEVTLLAGVYTLSFLSVMSLFAIGNMLLKSKRDRLPRSVRASWPTVVLALIAVLIGLVGNILLDPDYVRMFAIYFLGAGAVVAIMFLRLDLLKLVLFVSRSLLEKVQGMNHWLRTRITDNIDRINKQSVIYFAKGADPSELNRAALYVMENEQTDRLRVIHVYENEKDIPPELAGHLHTIDRLYPELRIDFIAVKGDFGPALIDALARRLNVPKNYMFIGTPGDHFPHRINALGGVRLIL